MEHDLHETEAIYQWLREESNYLPVGKDEWLPDYQLNNLLDVLLSIENFVFDVLKSNKPAFSLKIIKLDRNDIHIEREIVVEHALAQYFRKVIDWYAAYNPSYQYSPHAQIFFSSCAALPLHREYFIRPNQQTAIPGIRAFELFNEFIEVIRTKARSPDFRRIQYDLKYNASRIYRDAERYVRCLFRKHAKLLVIRIDLSYQKEYSHLITAEKCRQDFARFLNNFRHNKELSKDKAGYIWSLEYAPAKGFHYHCLFFYNGHEAQSDFYWGKRLGEYWEQVAPYGQYWNCNTKEKKADYERLGRLGIGRIHRDEEQTINNLLYIVGYMTKIEQYLLYCELKKCKRFGRGQCKAENRRASHQPTREYQNFCV